MIQSVLEADPPTLSSEYFSHEFCEFLHCCLQKNPSDRILPDVLSESPWLARCGAVSKFFFVVAFRDNPRVFADLETAMANVCNWIHSLQ